jgi:hypothetical protein
MSVTAHTARVSMQALADVFVNRIISSDIWPACSLDLDPCYIPSGVVSRTEITTITLKRKKN